MGSARVRCLLGNGWVSPPKPYGRKALMCAQGHDGGGRGDFRAGVASEPDGVARR